MIPSMPPLPRDICQLQSHRRIRPTRPMGISSGMNGTVATFFSRVLTYQRIGVASCILSCMLLYSSETVVSAHTVHYASTSVWHSLQYCSRNPNARRYVQMTVYFKVDSGPGAAGMETGQLFSHHQLSTGHSPHNLHAFLGPLTLTATGGIRDGVRVKVRGVLSCTTRTVQIQFFSVVTVRR
jgi:hypothetical protein